MSRNWLSQAMDTTVDKVASDIADRLSRTRSALIKARAPNPSAFASKFGNLEQPGRIIARSELAGYRDRLGNPRKVRR